jgi:SAM-dependent methyltransferase
MFLVVLFQPASVGWLLLVLLLIALGLAIFSPGGVWFPTSKRHIRTMLQMAELKPGELVYDLGCGDGRVLILAAEEFGARGVGIEIDALRYRLARWRVRRAGLEDRIRLVRGSFHHQDLSSADVVTLYLVQEMINRLAPKLARELRPGARLVSNTFVVPGLKVTRYDKPADLRLYTIPKKKTADTQRSAL